MKNKFSTAKISLSFLLLIVFALSFFAFNDSGDYKIIGNVIVRGPSKMYMSGSILIKFKDINTSFTNTSTGKSSVDNSISKLDAKKVIQLFPLNKNFAKRLIGDEDLSKVFEIKYDKSIDPFDAAAIVYSENSDILEYAEVNVVYQPDYNPNDPQISAQYHISKINSQQAWDITKGDTTMIIGIVDSGTDYTHPDLAANFKYNWADPVNGIDDDGNGYIDDFKGWDFGDGDNDPDCGIAANDHGSHVSGCATQVTDNGVHGAGIGFNSKFKCTKHNTSGGAGLYYTDLGITYMYQNGAKVINCSFGSSVYSATSQAVMNNAFANGTVICASAGNDGLNTARYPASYANVVNVAASNSSDLKASFSNYHTTVDVIAPGEGILSTVWKNSYAVFDGTSMSSPITTGTVALIRASHPTWTAQQVVDRLLIGVDSIYNLNPSYVGLIGTGRVNAFKCVADLPILKINSFTSNDSLFGNNDKVYDVNEIIALRLNLKNSHIAGNNVSIRLTTESPYITMVQDSLYIGDVGAYNNLIIDPSKVFKVKANSNCPYDVNIAFKLAYSSTAYTDNSANTFTVKFRQGFAVHSANNMKLCLTKDGAVGKKAESYGTGLQIGTGTTNNLYEGGLMIGISNTKVSDECRRGTTPANVSDTDFVALTSYSLTTPGTSSAQDGYGKFNDNGAGSNSIGVEVEANSYEFNTTEDMNYVLLKYKVKNTNSSALNNVYIGLFTLMSPDGYYSTGNISRFNSANKLAYTYNTGVSNRYLGLGLMTNQNLNIKILPLIDVLNGFTTQEKWDALSSGVVNDSLGPGGNSYVLSVGPLSIPANQSETVGFAILNAANLSDLITFNTRAKFKFGTVGITQISTEIPKEFNLGQNYPNPFNPMTNIKFAIPKNSFVSMKIVDILGREIATLVNEVKDAGYYEVSYNASKLSSGVYFYKIEANGYTDIKRMVVLK